MSAKVILRRNKTNIQSILSANAQRILDKVYEKEIISYDDYKNIKSIDQVGGEKRVREIVDTILDKGEAKCKDFLDLLKTDERIKETFPDLENLQLNYTVHPVGPRQETTSAARTADVGQDNRPSLESLQLNYTVHPVGSRQETTSADSTGDADDETEYYTLTHNPRGRCVIISMENFTTPEKKPRTGTQKDINSLKDVFTRLGFKVDIVKDLTADEIRTKLQNLAKEDFLYDDALVVFVLSNGRKGVVYGSDGRTVSLEELTWPFTSDRAPTLAGKPKLFFIQACQGGGYQTGAQPCPSQPRQGGFSLAPPKTTTQVKVAQPYKEDRRESRLEEDSFAHVSCKTVASHADFLMGMATMPGYRSFRDPDTGSIYIQELCRQLMRSAGSSKMDDILTILTRVNREVNKLNLKNYKQMPYPSYTLTKRLVLKFV